MRTTSPTAMLTICLLIDCRIINRCSLILQGNLAGSAPCSAHCGWMVGESVQLLDDFPRCVDVRFSNGSLRRQSTVLTCPARTLEATAHANHQYLSMLRQPTEAGNAHATRLQRGVERSAVGSSPRR